MIKYKKYLSISIEFSRYNRYVFLLEKNLQNNKKINIRILLRKKFLHYTGKIKVSLKILKAFIQKKKKPNHK